MAYVHIRIPDDLYKAVQTVLSSELNTDLSRFVRRILLDTLLTYGDCSTIDPVLAGMGLKHEAQTGPCLILDMAKDFYLDQVLEQYCNLGDDPEEKRRIRSKLAREYVLTIEQQSKNKPVLTEATPPEEK